MNILYLSRWLPYPANNGSKLRIYNLLERLSDYGHRIHLVTFYDPVEDAQEAVAHLGRFCASVDCIVYKPFQLKGWRNRAAFLEPRPHSVAVSFQTDIAEKISRLLANHTIDILVATEIDMAIYGMVAHQYGIPAVLEALELGVMREQFKHIRGTAEFARHSLRWLKYVSYTRHLAKHYALISTVSDIERRLIESVAPNARVHVLPNGADLRTNAFHPFNMAERVNRLVYNGALTFYANYEAMQFFLDDVWADLRAIEPQFELHITGRYDGVDLEGLFGGSAPPPGIVLTGYQPDLQPLISTSLACIVPLVRGQGTRLKILEAFAIGTPVISTTKGAEGLAVQHEHQLLIADRPEQFVAAVQRLRNERGLAEQLVTSARTLVETTYNWDTIAAEFDGLLHAVTGTRVNRSVHTKG